MNNAFSLGQAVAGFLVFLGRAVPENDERSGPLRSEGRGASRAETDGT
jgi:hypothetical protein